MISTAPFLPTIDDVCLEALRLPCSPALLPRLSDALQNEASSTGDISDIIQIDPALASATLRLANSAYFGGASHAVETVEQAILRLGAKEIYRLAALALVGRWPVTNQSGCEWEPSDFSRHALCSAIATEVLAEISGRVDPQLAYTAGLTHELGKLAIAHSCGAFFRRSAPINKSTTARGNKPSKSSLATNMPSSAPVYSALGGFQKS